MMDTLVFRIERDSPDPDAIEHAAEAVRRGELVAFPTETVYGIGADAFNDKAVERLYEAKGRPASNPLQVLVARMDDVDLLANEIPPVARAIMDRFFPGPLTLVLRASPAVSERITAGTGNVGIRMPDHPVALALIQAAGTPIAASSANLSGQPPPRTADEVLTHLKAKISVLLDAGPATLGLSSTVLDVTQWPPRILRAGSLTEQDLLPFWQEASQ